MLEIFFVAVAFTSQSALEGKIVLLLFIPIIATLVVVSHMSLKSAVSNDVNLISTAIAKALKGEPREESNRNRCSSRLKACRIGSPPSDGVAGN
jgi:hypothetical protein